MGLLRKAAYEHICHACIMLSVTPCCNCVQALPRFPAPRAPCPAPDRVEIPVGRSGDCYPREVSSWPPSGPSCPDWAVQNGVQTCAGHGDGLIESWRPGDIGRRLWVATASSGLANASEKDRFRCAVPARIAALIAG